MYRRKWRTFVLTLGLATLMCSPTWAANRNRGRAYVGGGQRTVVAPRYGTVYRVPTYRNYRPAPYYSFGYSNYAPAYRSYGPGYAAPGSRVGISIGVGNGYSGFGYSNGIGYGGYGYGRPFAPY